jgi:hypothetical protein
MAKVLNGLWPQPRKSDWASRLLTLMKRGMLQAATANCRRPNSKHFVPVLKRQSHMSLTLSTFSLMQREE